MAERSYFYDSTADDERIYQAADFARFHAQIIGNGVSNTATLPDLEVTAQNNMDVSLGAGYMFANGYMYENDSTMTLTHDIADADNDRIDRIIIRFDSNPENRRNYAVIKKGTPSSDPVPPSVTRDNYIHEMSVAQVRIIAGKSFIEQSEITDERENDEVCGYIPLHNIYRGLSINEFGMVTMPNQSYVQMVDNQSFTIIESGSSYTTNKIPMRPDIDRQVEVSDDSFYAKADGTYQFNFSIRLADSLSTNSKMESNLVINDQNGINDRVYLFSSPGIGSGDLNFFGTATTYLEKGDKVSLFVSTIRLSGGTSSTQRRLTISKVN